MLSARAADKTKDFGHLIFNSTLQLISGISSHLQKLLKYFNDSGIVAFFRILFAPWTAVFCNNLALYLKDLNLLSLAISTYKLFASSLE